MRGRILGFTLVLASLLAAAFFAMRWRQAEIHARATARWTHFVMDSLGTSVSFPPPPPGPAGRDWVYWQWVAISAQLQSRRWQQAVRGWVERRATLLDLPDIENLRRQGLEDPPRQLRDSLVAHPELIPFPGELGGTMFFEPGENIVLLTPPFVFAEFEDGHVNGSMLLEYEILPGPRIGWKRLWARRE